MAELSYSTSLSRAYRERRDAMAQSFPAGCQFLQGLEVLCEGDNGFHMGTAQNVQFYLEEGFLFHLQLVGPNSANPQFMLSPQHHGQIREGTVDASHLLFRGRIHKVVSSLRLTGMHVMRQQRGYRISSATPSTFFDLLVGQLFDIVRSGDMAPSQTDLFGEPEQPRRRRRRRRRRGAATERRIRSDGERLLALATDVDDAIGLLTAELQDRLGGQVHLRVAAGKASLLLAAAEGVAVAGDWQAVTATEVVQQALAEIPAPAAPTSATDDEALDELEELGSLVVE